MSTAVTQKRKSFSYFTPNVGQWEDTQIYFELQGANHGAYFTSERVIYTFLENAIHKNEELNPSNSGILEQKKKREVRSDRIDFRFLNADPNVKPEAKMEMPGKVHYYRGSEPNQWHTNISPFHEVVYSELWTGIDLVFRGENGELKYEFVVHPGARVEDICFTYDGAKKLTLDEAGNLVIDTAIGEISDQRPVSYQIKDGQVVYLESSFQLNEYDKGEYVVHFNLAKEYDPRYTLIIDPGLIYSSYLGGNEIDQA